ncbi:MAG: hypothetical protein POELPBGB_02033 [Bacteroidia bacterium]|nr:hypothetical protein [Bacteroidia bacterium]
MVAFFRNLILFTLAVSLGIFVWNKFMPAEYVFQKAWFILALYFVITVAIHWGAVQSASKGGQQFIRYFLAATMLKLFLLLIIITLYVMTKPADAVHFAVCFLVLYLFYTVFETIHLLKHFKNE